MSSYSAICRFSTPKTPDAAYLYFRSTMGFINSAADYQHLNGFYRRAECRELVYLLYKKTCQGCQANLENRRDYVSGHIIPRRFPDEFEKYFPGLDVDNLLNLYLLCTRCNIKQSAYFLAFDHVQGQFFKQSARVIDLRYNRLITHASQDRQALVLRTLPFAALASRDSVWAVAREPVLVAVKGLLALQGWPACDEDQLISDAIKSSTVRALAIYGYGGTAWDKSCETDGWPRLLLSEHMTRLRTGSHKGDEGPLPLGYYFSETDVSSTTIYLQRPVGNTPGRSAYRPKQRGRLGPLDT